MELIKTIEKYHYKELELERKTETGAYRNDNIPVSNRPDTSWIHENNYGESAHFNVQRVTNF